jgi:hypothetical protein
MIQLMNDMRIEVCPNNIDDTGRKICPITMDSLTINNSIKIEGVLYSNRGLSRWIKQELNSAKNKFIISDIIPLLNTLPKPYICSVERMAEYEFSVLFYIRSPFTNEYYSNDTKKKLYDIFIKIGRNKYNDIETFMKI